LAYPFSQEARETAKSLARDIHQLIELMQHPDYEVVVHAAEERVLGYLEQPPKVPPLPRPLTAMMSLVYPLTRVLVSHINSPHLRQYQAEAEAKAVLDNLQRERLEFVLRLARSALGWQVEPNGTLTERARRPPLVRSLDLRIRFEHYLECASQFHDPRWALINRVLDKGWVWIQTRELHRLIAERFKMLILSSHIELPSLLPERLVVAAQEIESHLHVARLERQGRTGVARPTGEESSSIVLEAFPPCMARMYADAQEGKNLPHTARFALAAFLLNIGMSIDEVVQVFSTAPDFVSPRARYQVEHIAGVRGGRHGSGYTPPSCRRLQGNGLCPAHLGESDDPLCEYVLHPLRFYETRVWEVSQRLESHDWYARRRQRKQVLY